jgi:hypothetical protein
MANFPRSCEDVKRDIEQRHALYQDNGWVPIPITKSAILHRLIRQEDIDPNTNKPKSSVFTNFGLSVLVEGENFPFLNIEEEVQNSPIFIAAIALEVEFLENFGFELYHDPHPDPLGRPQHTNHAQVICKKTQGAAKKMRDCRWSVPPP